MKGLNKIARNLAKRGLYSKQVFSRIKSKDQTFLLKLMESMMDKEQYMNELSLYYVEKAKVPVENDQAVVIFKTQQLFNESVKGTGIYKIVKSVESFLQYSDESETFYRYVLQFNLDPEEVEKMTSEQLEQFTDLVESHLLDCFDKALELHGYDKMIMLFPVYVYADTSEAE